MDAVMNYQIVLTSKYQSNTAMHPKDMLLLKTWIKKGNETLTKHLMQIKFLESKLHQNFMKWGGACIWYNLQPVFNISPSFNKIQAIYDI